MGATVQASDGTAIPLDSVGQQFTYDGSFISEIIVNYQGKIFVQTFTNDGTNIIYISNWVAVSAPPSQQIMVDQSDNVMIDQDGINIMVTQ